MNRYRKLIVALAGLLILYAQRKFGLDLSGTEELIADIVINGAIAFLVWRVPNEPPK